MTSPHVSIEIDLGRIRRSAGEIAQRVGVPVLAVIKADAYGLGAGQVAGALADVAEGFCVFSLAEAVAADLWRRTGKPAIALGPPDSLDPGEYQAQHVRPAVSTPEQAAALRRADPLLCVDTGMQRFACPALPEQIEAVLRAGQCREAFTHAIRLEQALQLARVCEGRNLRLHAAASSLLDEPAARLDAVRPGLALYRGAVRISTRLVEARDSAAGPIGYSGFAARRHGVILAGYAQGLRCGPCLVNGRRQRILEVGMQSAYVELGPGDCAGDEVLLLGDGLSDSEVAAAWACTPHEVLVRLCAAGRRSYR